MIINILKLTNDVLFLSNDHKSSHRRKFDWATLSAKLSTRGIFLSIRAVCVHGKVKRVLPFYIWFVS